MYKKRVHFLSINELILDLIKKKSLFQVFKKFGVNLTYKDFK